MFEEALIFGMTTEDYWFGNPQHFFIYANAYEKKIKYDAQKECHMSWSNGFYTYLAIAQALSDALSSKKKKIFPMKPPNLNKNELTAEELAKKEEVKEKIAEHNRKIAMILQKHQRN